MRGYPGCLAQRLLWRYEAVTLRSGCLGTGRIFQEPHNVGTMKEFKLTAWPELPAPYQRIAYRRMLSDMSHRFVTAQQLCESSGATKLEVRVFLQMLSERGLLRERDHFEEESSSLFGPLSGWLRRALHGENATH